MNTTTKRKNRYSTALLLLMTAPALLFAQEPETECDGVYETGSANLCNPSSNAFEHKYNIPHTFIPKANEVLSEKTMHVNVIIWQNNSGGENWQNTTSHKQRLDQIFEWIDDLFLKNNPDPSHDFTTGSVNNLTKKGIRLHVNDYYFIQNDSGNKPMAHGITISNGYQKYQQLLSQTHPELANEYNIHIAGWSVHGGAWGYAVGGGAGIVTSNNSGNRSYVNCDTCPISIHPQGGRDWSFAEHIAHEIGHNLDLYHMYHGDETYFFHTNDTAMFLHDCFRVQNGPPSTCPVGGVGFTDGSNNYKICYPKPGCKYRDSAGDTIPYADSSCTNNYMTSNGGTYMSPRQLGRSHKVLSMSPSMAAATCGFHDEPWVISTGETCDFEVQMYRDILIKENAQLVVTCTLRMMPEARIIVEKGASLVVDGGVITRAGKYCGDRWKGIEVHGSPTAAQSPFTQGYVELKNNARLEYAHEAIYLAKRVGSSNDPDTYGSFVWASNSTFYNCRRACSFYPYKSPGVFRLPNISYFKECEFLYDEKYPFSSVPLGITMWRVDGVTIEACVFENAIPHKKHRGTAITSIGGSYKLHPICLNIHCQGISQIPTEIRGFQYGVHSTKMGLLPARSISIKNVIFEDNCYAGYIHQRDNLVFTGNQIDIPDMSFSTAFTSSFPYGLYMSHSSDFEVSNNLFKSNGGASFFRKPVGFIILYSPFENMIHKNTFEGNVVAVEALDMNRTSTWKERGFQIRCNDFEGNRLDIYVPNKNMFPGGIAQHQGALGIEGKPAYAAGNLFSHPTPTTGSDMFNYHGDEITYFHHDPASEPRVLPRPGHIVNVTGYDTEVTFDEQTRCRSLLDTGAFGGGGGIDPPFDFVMLNTLRNLKGELTDMHELYQQLIDGGDTPELIAQIFTTPGSENYDLYIQLMEQSPYLSDEALIEIIQKPGFPDVLLRNILIENPQSVSNDNVWTALMERDPALPQYMIDDIINGTQSIGGRQFLEAAMGNKSLAVHYAAGKVIRALGRELDSAETGYSVTDTLLAVYDLMDEPRYYLQKAQTLHYFDLSGVSEALDAAKNHPSVTGTEQEAEYAAMADIYEIFFAQEAHFDSLNPEQAGILNDIFESGLLGVSITAHQMLFDAGEEVDSLLYDPVYIPEELSERIAPAQKTVAKAVKESPDRFSLYPNPAVQYTVLKYELSGKAKTLHYELLDLQGRVLTGGSFENRVKDDHVIELPDLANGRYLFRLYKDDEVVGSKQLTIFKK
jgi:hypothetical protein